jgi:hypothetical protein
MVAAQPLGQLPGKQFQFFLVHPSPPGELLARRRRPPFIVKAAKLQLEHVAYI